MLLLQEGGSILVTFVILTIDHCLDHINQQYTDHLTFFVWWELYKQNASWLLYLFSLSVLFASFLCSCWLPWWCCCFHYYHRFVIIIHHQYVYLISVSSSLQKASLSSSPPPPCHHHQSSSTSPILPMDKVLHRFRQQFCHQFHQTIPTCLQSKLVR